MSYVVADGKSNWLEGVILVCKLLLILILVLLPKPSILGLYIIIAVSFWFYPGKWSSPFLSQANVHNKQVLICRLLFVLPDHTNLRLY